MILRIKVKPGAKSNTIKKESDGTLSIRVAAPPVDGKANKMLLEFLSSVFDIPKTSISLKSGESSRYKTLILPDTARINDILSSIQ